MIPARCTQAPKYEHIASQLKHSILTGELLPGDKLPSEAEICSTYGVSRSSARGAISALAAQGLVETRKGSGSFVLEQCTSDPALCLQKINRIDLFEFRRILETESAGLAAQRADDTAIAHMRRLAILMQESSSKADIALYDGKFHLALAQASHNSAILQIFKLLQDSFSKMFYQNVCIMGSEGYLYHLKIISAIESRNSDLAREYMQEHLDRAVEKTSMINYNIP